MVGFRLIEGYFDRNPHVGILASFAGFSTTVVSAMNSLSMVFGFVGALFGCIAGYYTMRCQYRKWKNPKSDKDE